MILRRYSLQLTVGDDYQPSLYYCVYQAHKGLNQTFFHMKLLTTGVLGCLSKLPYCY